MKVLVDTAAFWWLALESQKLSTTALQVFDDPGNELLLSPVVVWELLVKHTIGKLKVTEPIQDVLARARASRAFVPWPLAESAVLHLPSLPPVHRDPFDRLLICQALDANATILTPDAAIRVYPVSSLW